MLDIQTSQLLPKANVIDCLKWLLDTSVLFHYYESHILELTSSECYLESSLLALRILVIAPGDYKSWPPRWKRSSYATGRKYFLQSLEERHKKGVG